LHVSKKLSILSKINVKIKVEGDKLKLRAFNSIQDQRW